MVELLPYEEAALDPAAALRGRDGVYLADPRLIAAANAALALGRPLLLTGEPGSGKTEFAFAAASALDPTGPLDGYVRSDTRGRDLLYTHDAVRRFADAHHGGEAGQTRARYAGPYVELQALGRALMSPTRRVVLIDEIDKAPRDLPNDLLRELDRGEFEIPEILEGDPEVSWAPGDPKAREERYTLRRQMVPPGTVRPFVVITSNVERQLPDAFLRRCVFFHIDFPSEARLVEILRTRFEGGDPKLFEDLAVTLGGLREVAGLVKKPSTSELIDQATVLTRVFALGAVRMRVKRVADQVRARRAAGGGEVRWAELPALECLLKLRDDLVTVGAAARVGG